MYPQIVENISSSTYIERYHNPIPRFYKIKNVLINVSCSIVMQSSDPLSKLQKNHLFWIAIDSEGKHLT